MDVETSSKEVDQPVRSADQGRVRKTLSTWYRIVVVGLLLANYFLAQYDKFILSYFRDDISLYLDLSNANYGILSGYATGIVYAVLALPLAYLADYTSKRVWVLAVSAVWWSACVIFQGLSRRFWQILLARIGMGIGQSAVEALSISLISDYMDREWAVLADRYDCGLTVFSIPRRA